MAWRRRSSLGVLPRRALAGGAGALQDHHPAGLARTDLARAGPASGLAVHKYRRALHVDLVPGHLDPIPVVMVLGRGIPAAQFIFFCHRDNCTSCCHGGMLAGGVL